MTPNKTSFATRVLYCFTILPFLLTSVCAQNYHSERRYLQASNCNCSLLTPVNFSTIQWYGSCDKGYCDGYGTVNYYDQNGGYSGKFIGNVTQGLLNGFGTRYYADGSIAYQGKLVNNVYVDAEPFAQLDDIIRDFVIDSLLSGGVNRQCEIVKSIFSRTDELQEIDYKITCDGQFVKENHYTCTLVFTNRLPYINIIDANDNAQVFLTLNFIKYAQRMSDWFEKQSQNTQR